MLRHLYRLIAHAYVYVCGRPATQRFNTALLFLALRARGYNNYDPRTNGELYFLKLLAAHQPKLCIDIGANVGDYARALLETTSADVISFEPLPKAFAILLTLEDKYRGRFAAHNVGVGARNEKLQLNYGREDSQLASFCSDISEIGFVGKSNVNSIEADVTTLDRFYETNLKHRYTEIDLLKIDTEGFEHEVLSGAQKTIAELRPKLIQIEFNQHQLFRNHSLLTLAALMPGYRAFQLLPGGMVPRDPKQPESNMYYYANFVFVRGDITLVEL